MLKALLNSPSGLWLHPRTWWFNLLKWRCRGAIQSGPFTGMKYPGVSIGSNSPPKLLGTYELELHECIRSLTAQRWCRTLVVGAAEGYYAIGLAVLTGCDVIAFEQEEAGHPWLRKMAEANGTAGRVEIRGRCESADLIQAIGRDGPNLIIMDVEGYETVLLADLPGAEVTQSTPC